MLNDFGSWIQLLTILDLEQHADVGGADQHVNTNLLRHFYPRSI